MSKQKLNKSSIELNSAKMINPIYLAKRMQFLGIVNYLVYFVSTFISLKSVIPYQYFSQSSELQS